MKKENILELLSLLNFSTKNNKIYTIDIDNQIITINIDNQEIIYPKDIVVNDKTTSNFSKNENFVVLECVVRLLKKGYKAKHIEIEPKWKLGHETKSGKADIIVRDMKNKTLLIIECKTYGKELDNELEQTKKDGGQLFSYFQQERNTRYLCLYSSDIIDNKIKSLYYLISVTDNQEYINNNKKTKSYKEATTNKELFSVWEQTYKKTYETKGLFEEDILAYNIGKQKYTLKDLQIVDSSQKTSKLYNKYATILRKYNVSSKENAFDKLVNLFLAKIVDETSNCNDLQFYWKGIFYDNEFDLQDRLQKLYKEGMGKYLKEQVTYVEKQQIQNAFKLFKNDPDQTKETILNYFRQLKFFTNNDFAFIDVHNEELFYQNSKILLETVELLQDMKLRQKTNNQFLGDLFEGFLNQGIKQSEGQFFTPLPIVRFIISSLPLKYMIETNKEPLSTIDYACGAGHFLTEYAQQISDLVEKPEKYYSNIVGIEKESRLAKVSKVSCFMFGKGEIKIFYHDGLANNKNIQEENFDLLIANPPYSVKGFLETLTQKDREQYELYNKKINLNTNAIECFFVERAQKLLKENGICAIILPITILSKDGIYETTQKIILKYFSIVAISQLPKGTFGQTGQETIVLFLQKKSRVPDLIEHYRNRINCWFNNDFSKDKLFKDFHYVEDYCKYTKQKLEDYKKIFGNKDTKLIEQEKEKLFYYILARNNDKKVLILRTPQETKEIQEFLGYKWSKRKGTEGIQYLNSQTENDEEQLQINEINSIDTPLFNPIDLYDDTKINTLIRKHFNDEEIDIPEALQDKIFILNLEDMLDFSKDKFSSRININAMFNIDINSKYNKEKLANLVDIKDKSTFQVNVAENNTTGKYPFFTSGENVYKYDDFIVDNENIFLSTGGKAYIKFYNGKASYSTDTLCITSNDKNKYITKYIFYVLESIIKQISLLCFQGSGLKHLQRDILLDIEIPLPSKNIQNKIIQEIDILTEKECDEYKKYKNKMDKIKEILLTIKGNKYTLSNIGNVKMCRRIFNKETRYKGDIPFYKIGTFGKKADSYISKKLFDEYKKKYPYPKKGDVLISAAGTVGKIVVFDGSPAYFQDSNIVWIDNNEKIVLNSYLSKYYSVVDWKVSKGGSVDRLYNDDLLETVIIAPTIEQQKNIVSEIEKLEKEIEKSKEVLNKIPQKKQEILDKYLK